MIVGNDNGHLTRIEDIGKAELGTYNPRASVSNEWHEFRSDRDHHPR